MQLYGAPHCPQSAGRDSISVALAVRMTKKCIHYYSDERNGESLIVAPSFGGRDGRIKIAESPARLPSQQDLALLVFQMLVLSQSGHHCRGWGCGGIFIDGCLSALSSPKADDHGRGAAACSSDTRAAVHTRDTIKVHQPAEDSWLSTGRPNQCF